MKRIPPKLQPWFDARLRLGLSHATVQMARELGMNPKKLGKLVPTAGQGWKAPLPDFVAHCYEKSHGRRMPEKVRTLEQVVEDEERRNEVRRAKRGTESTSASAALPSQGKGQYPRGHEA
jgi:hypothetical protein